jgi:lysophospholipase L1-like esterase
MHARYLALGDSYTIGEGVQPEERWPAQLVRLLRERAVPVQDPRIIARTGWTTQELAAAIARENPAGPFDLVSLLIGVNDQYRGGSVEAYRTAFRCVFATALALAGGLAERVIVVSVPDWGVTPFAAAEHSEPERVAREIDAFNAANRAEAAARGAQYVDVTQASREAVGDASLLVADGLHPSGRLYAAWARLALDASLAALRV